MLKHILLILFTALASAAWAQSAALPLYTEVATDPADGATVSTLTTITVSLGREGYDAPLGIMPGAAPVTATFTSTTGTTAISGITAAVSSEQLVIAFPAPIATEGTVVVSIPEGLTNNLALPVATMTTDEIIAEGGCTNPAITLTLNVAPTLLPVRDVTGVGYDTQWLTDDEGNFLKDEKGQYVRIDKYDSLIDAQLTPPSADNEGDRVTVMYFWYDSPFATIDYQGGAAVTNVTTGRSVAIANVSFKTGGDSYRNNVIELRLSTEAYIGTAEYHQGVYEVTLPEGIATTADGLKNAGITFRFTYGDPSKAYVPEEIDLDAFLGSYTAVSEVGEEASDEHFTLSKTPEGSYVVENLCGSSLVIPVEAVGEEFYLKATENDLGEAFMSLRGTDVEISFTHNADGRPYIYLDQYAIFGLGDEPFIGGIILFGRDNTQPIGIADAPAPDAAALPAYDLHGRRITAAPSRIIVSQGRKQLVR